MTITNTVKHNLSFQVEAFWDEEGGMGYENFGPKVSELPDALRILESAKNTRSKINWIITIETLVVK